MTASAQRALAPSRALRVKFILPALTEATDPYWRPIKYSLFPPLGLATLAWTRWMLYRERGQWLLAVDRKSVV